MLNDVTRKNLENMASAYVVLFHFLLSPEEEVKQLYDNLKREYFKGYTEEDKRVILIFCENCLKAVENKKSCTGYPYDPARMALHKEVMEILIRRLKMQLLDFSKKS